MAILMNYPEPAIRVTTFNGSPLVSVQGTMSDWHAKAVQDVIQSLLPEAPGALTLDVSCASFSDQAGLASLIRMLGAVRSQVRAVVVASGPAAAMLKRADLQPLLTLCASIDEAAEIVRPQPDHLSPERMAERPGDDELPLAA